jgi:hypothetical protein
MKMGHHAAVISADASPVKPKFGWPFEEEFSLLGV